MNRALPAPVAAPWLNARAIRKRFGGVHAVDGLDFEVTAGEIVALLGKNGAGKSTFMQILAGAHPTGSYGGEIAIDGHPFRCAGVADAEAAGVALVPQEIQVASDLTVSETLFLNREPTRHGLIDRPQRLAQARRALASLDLEVDPQAPIGSLDLASQQLVIIARALSRNARLLILDEPTAALTARETRRLFDRLRRLRAQGTSSIFVSHRLAEVFAIADRIVVMRDGKVSGQFGAPVAAAEVLEAMLGKAAELEACQPLPDLAGQETALEVRGLVVREGGVARRPRVNGVDLSLRRGEILGLFGLRGAGCGSLAAAIFGAWPGPVAGEIRLAGRPVRIGSPAEAVALGLGLVAQDRRDCLLFEHSIAENVALASLPALGRLGFLDRARLRRIASEQVARLAIRASGIDAAVATLSGGNQQKVQLARWLASGATTLLLVDPTRGIDIGTRREIHQLWRQLAAQGYALLLVSSEAEELLQVCHRVLVLRDGERAAEFPLGRPGDPVTEERLLRAASGL
jgi:ABC-type sugar transport system ATPase subunit